MANSSTTNRKKSSIDLRQDNFDKVMALRKVYNVSSIGSVIDIIIDAFTQIPDAVSLELINFCLENIRTLCGTDKFAIPKYFTEEEMVYAKFMFKKQACKTKGECITKDVSMTEEEEIVAYIRLLDFISKKGALLDMPGSNNARMEIKDAHVVYPDDWWVLEAENLSECSDVGVIVTKFGEDLGIKPIVFGSNKPIQNLSLLEVKYIYECCGKQFPTFGAMLQNVVEIEKDENGKSINADEYLNTPRPIIFYIPEYNQADTNLFLGSVIVKHVNNKGTKKRN